MILELTVDELVPSEMQGDQWDGSPTVSLVLWQHHQGGLLSIAGHEFLRSSLNGSWPALLSSLGSLSCVFLEVVHYVLLDFWLAADTTLDCYAAGAVVWCGGDVRRLHSADAGSKHARCRLSAGRLTGRAASVEL